MFVLGLSSCSLAVNTMLNQIFDEVCVINLDRSPDRLAAIKDRLEALGVKFHRISAVDGKTLSPEELLRSCEPSCAKFATKGAIGCALSHRKVWRRMVKRHLQQVLVLEDDAVFLQPRDDFEKRFQRSWTAVPKDWDAVKIGASSSSGDRANYDAFDWLTTIIPSMFSRSKRMGAGTRVNEYIVRPDTSTGTHCYAIKLSGAKKLLRDTHKLTFPAHVDILMSSHVPDLKLYGFIDTALVRQPHAASESLIGAGGLPRVGNYLSDRVPINKNGVSLGWMLSEPIARLGDNIQLTGWRGVWFLLGLTLGLKRWPIFAAAMAADELILGLLGGGKANTHQLLFDIFMFLLGAWLKQKMTRN